MSETSDAYVTKSEITQQRFKVCAWVRDQDLEHVLNDRAKQNWQLVEMFRNAPGGDGLETTTLVFEEPEWGVIETD